MPELKRGKQIGDDNNGYIVVELLSIDDAGNSTVIGYAVLDPSGNEVWRGDGDDLDEACGQRDEFADPSVRVHAGPSM